MSVQFPTPPPAGCTTTPEWEARLAAYLRTHATPDRIAVDGTPFYDSCEWAIEGFFREEHRQGYLSDEHLARILATLHPPLLRHAP